jgi:hypothetical protein
MAVSIDGTNGLTFNDSTTIPSGYSGAKAWVNYNATGTPAIRASYNVSSVVINATGAHQINFTTPFADVNYSFVATNGNDGVNRSFVQFDSSGTSGGIYGQQLVGSIKFYVGGTTGLYNVPYIWAAFFR